MCTNYGCCFLPINSNKKEIMLLGRRKHWSTFFQITVMDSFNTKRFYKFDIQFSRYFKVVRCWKELILKLSARCTFHGFYEGEIMIHFLNIVTLPRLRNERCSLIKIFFNVIFNSRIVGEQLLLLLPLPPRRCHH